MKEISSTSKCSDPASLKSNDEVEEVLSFSLTDLLLCKSLPGVEFTWPGYGSFISPVFFPADIIPNSPIDTPIYGGTAHVLWELLEILATASDRQVPSLIPSLSRFP